MSIAICTHNRARQLGETLQWLARLEIPPDLPAELLIVDNASTDQTATVIGRYDNTRLAVRHLTEPRPGKCRALNRAVGEARGRVLLLTDDDVAPPADWVVRMAGPLLSGAADLVAGGVRIAPHLERPWLRGMLRTWFAATDHLDPADPTLDGVGANMAFDRRVWAAVGGFDERLGPGALGGCDDTLFFQRARAAGFRITPVLGCEVEHRFDASRLSRANVLACAAAYGRSAGYVEYHARGRTFGSSPTLMLRKRAVLAARRLLRRSWWRSEGCDEWEAVSVLVLNMLRQNEAEARPSRGGHPIGRDDQRKRHPAFR